MNHRLDERTAALLGKALLAQASDDEVAALEALRGESSPVRDALDAIGRTQGAFRSSSVGEELEMTADDLPAYLRPQALAAAHDRWLRRGTRTGLLAAAALSALLVAGILVLRPAAPTALLAGSVAAAAVLVLGGAVLASRRHHARMRAEIERGGARWRETVERVEAQRLRYLSPTARGCLIVCLCSTPVLFVLGGVAHAPLDRIFTYLAWVTVATGVVIWQRRRTLADLGREA